MGSELRIEAAPAVGTHLQGPTARKPRYVHQSHLVLGALPSAVPCARLHARLVLAEWDLKALAETAELIVSELVTNAVRASTAPDGRPRYDAAGMPVVVLQMASDRIKLLVEVWDVIPAAPAAARPGPDDESGRGLMLVAAQADHWSWQTVPGWPGKVVWAELLA